MTKSNGALFLGLHGKNWDFGITPCLKLGLQKLGDHMSGSTSCSSHCSRRYCPTCGLTGLKLRFRISVQVKGSGTRYTFWNRDLGITGSLTGPYSNRVLYIEKHIIYYIYIVSPLKICCAWKKNYSPDCMAGENEGKSGYFQYDSMRKVD